MRVSILGFGLIGGSIARALQSARGAEPAVWEVVGWSPTGRGPARARAEGIIERAAATVAEAIDGADLVVLAAPPLACLELLDELAGAARAWLAHDAVVTDVASTKSAVVAHALDRGVRFVGGHPMAGREVTGYAAASADLFRGRPWLIVPGDDEAAAARVERLADACGALPVRLGADEHDAAVAAISHLPLALSAALVEAVTSAPDWPLARRLAATGWRDMTRLARGDVEMGAGIAATNAEALAARLRTVRDVIDGWLRDLDVAAGPDTDAIRARLAAARDRLGEADA